MTEKLLTNVVHCFTKKGLCMNEWIESERFQCVNGKWVRLFMMRAFVERIR